MYGISLLGASAEPGRVDVDGEADPEQFDRFGCQPNIDVLLASALEPLDGSLVG